LVVDNAFLQGKWLEACIAPNGSWGNSVTVPAGYNHRPGSSDSYLDPITLTTATGDGLDFSYDQGHDGWTVGTPPWYGAYFLPGTPFNGWSVQIDDTMGSAFYSTGHLDTTLGGNFAGTVTGYSGPSCWSPHAAATGIWQGTYGLRRPGLRNAMHITQVNEIDTMASWVNVTTKFYNTSDSVLRNVYYFVTGDPDNDEDLPGGMFPTNNHISYQGGPFDRHEVNARPPSIHQDAFSGLATQDCRAKVLIYQSWPPSMVTGNDLDLVYAGTPTSMGTTNYALGATTLSQDIAYGLVFRVGNIAPHDSAFISYGWIFSDTSAVDSLFNVVPQLSTQGVLHTPAQPDSVFGCNLTGCGVISDSFFAADIVNGENRKWSFSKWTWTPSTGLSTSAGTHVVIDIASLSGPVTYTITGVPDTTRGASCNYPNSISFTLYVQPCFSASSNLPCEGDTLFLTGTGDTTGASFLWLGPAGFSHTGQSTFRYPITFADTGTYSLIKTVGSNRDTTTTHVLIKALPYVTATSNGPICSGLPNILNLFANPDSLGETYSWSGPNGFLSGLQNPSIANPPVSDGGIYKVVTRRNGCHDSGYITVVIDSTPAVPTVSSNTPQCSGHRYTLSLTANDVTPGTQYTWAGPLGFTSSLQNNTIPTPHLPNSGTYTVTASVPYDGLTCFSKNTTIVVIDSMPNMPVVGSNAPICSGNTLLLNATSADLSSYSWTGPNGFISALQNPVIPLVTTPATGLYTISATLFYPGIPGGCISDSATLAVVIDSTPVVPGITSNSPGAPSICQGDTLFLYSSDSTALVTYSWAGPNLFTSLQQNPYIYPVMPAATGVYTVTAILGMCSNSAVTMVTIKPTPLIAATNNGPICTGKTDTLFLQAASNPGASFSWTGPYTFVSSAQNPYRTPAIMEYAGIYQVRSFLNGCYSLPLNDTVIINETPPAPWVSWLTFCQHYNAPSLQSFGDSIKWYLSGAVGAPSSFTPPIPPTGSDTVMWFYTTQTRMACESALDSFKVTINPQPVVTVSPSIGVCPHDTAILTAVDTDPIAYYHWAPRQYLRDTVGASVIVRPETSVTYTVVVTNKYGCTDTANVLVTVKAAALLSINTGDSVVLYPGESFQLDPMTNCSAFTWFPPAGLSDPNISNPVAMPEISTKYLVDGLTSWGCKAEDSVNVYISTESLLALPNAFTPGNGPNGTFKVIKRGVAKLRYFRIFDRWGVKVFETSDIDAGWDGTYKGAMQQFGVYVYEVGAVTSSGRTFEKHGNVTLIK
jgi:gliding motility-associated-like protein